MKQPIHNYGDPVLREKAETPITTLDAPLKKLAQDMIDTMHAAQGIGLAAQQVGRVQPLCVIDLPPDMDLDENDEPANEPVAMPLALLNPEILGAGNETWTREEGCLSFPQIMGKIERPWSITLRYMDLEGQTHECAFHGMLARVIQHEIDHLHGVLFIDRMSHVKKLALKGRLKRLREETEALMGDGG